MNIINDKQKIRLCYACGRHWLQTVVQWCGGKPRCVAAAAALRTAAEPAFYYPSTWDPHFITKPAMISLQATKLWPSASSQASVLIFYSISAGVFMENTNRCVISTLKLTRFAWVVSFFLFLRKRPIFAAFRRQAFFTKSSAALRSLHTWTAGSGPLGQHKHS